MPGLEGVQLHLVDSVEDALAFKRWLGESRPVLCIDTETEGLDSLRHRVRLIQLGDAQAGWAIPWQLWGGVAEEALRGYEGRLVMHNARFDVRMIERWSAVDGFPIALDRARVDDTMVMAHILDPRASVGLKQLTARLIDGKAARAQKVLEVAMAEQKWTWATVPIRFEPYWAYGALDTVLCARLWELLEPPVRVEAPKAYDLEMATTWVIQGMEDRGCQLDVGYTAERLAEFDIYSAEVEAYCVAQYGVLPGSDQKVVHRLQEDGVILTKTTASGARLALDKEVLESLEHPLAQLVLQRRRVQKLASGYLENFLKLHVDGILHPSFNTLREDRADQHYGARTGRMSVTNPALQTLPRRSAANPLAITVRNCITSRQGHTLVMADWDQIEQRLLAHFAKDPALQQAFSEGDFFTNIARELYADPALAKDDQRRQLTKNGMYGLGYGAGPEKIAYTTKQPLEAVQVFLDALAQRFPGIKRFQRETEQLALRRLQQEGEAYIRSPLTNRKHVAERDKSYTLVNSLIQGLAAEVLKMKDVELAAAGLDEYLVLNVHDEVVLDCPDELVQDVSQTLSQIMNDASLFDVPLTATVTTAKRWGEATK